MATIASFGVPQMTGGSTDAPILMPKLSYRFRVTMINFGGTPNQKQSSTFTSQVVSVSRPNLTHEEITVDVYNSKIYLAGKHTWDPLSLVLKDDIEGNVDKFIASQLQRQLNHAEQSAATSGGQSQCAMLIDALDGGNDLGGRAAAPLVLDSWSLAGCFIQNVQYGENNYSASEVTNITLSIRYDNADHVVNPGLNQGNTFVQGELSKLNAGARGSNDAASVNAPGGF